MNVLKLCLSCVLFISMMSCSDDLETSKLDNNFENEKLESRAPHPPDCTPGPFIGNTVQNLFGSDLTATMFQPGWEGPFEDAMQLTNCITLEAGCKDCPAVVHPLNHPASGNANWAVVQPGQFISAGLQQLLADQLVTAANDASINCPNEGLMTPIRYNVYLVPRPKNPGTFNIRAEAQFAYVGPCNYKPN